MPEISTRSRSALGTSAAKHRVGGPVDLARLALGEPDRRPRDLEVVELLGVDLGDRLGVERGRDRLERGGRGARGVVPARERGDQHGRAQLRRLRLPDQWLHPSSLSGCACGATPIASARRGKIDAWKPPSPRSIPRVAELRPGQRFEGRYACVSQGAADRPQRLDATSRCGCATAAARSAARVFRDADRIALRFEAGDAVAVRGRAERYRGELVVELDDARKLEPGSYDADRVPARRLSLRRRARGLPRAPRARDPRPPACARWSTRWCSRVRWPSRLPPRSLPPARGHHAYLGGLLEHTVAVAHAGARDLRRCIRGSTRTC